VSDEGTGGLSDEEVANEWQHIAANTDRMLQRVNDPDEFPVQPRSSLSGDDKCCGGYQVSHAVQMCLVAGVDHLHAAKSHLLDFRMLPAQALFSVIRGALENFAAAYWILHPRLRNDRIERTMRWHAKNFKDQKTALEPKGLESDATRDAKLAKLYALATSRGISNATIKKGYTSTEAIAYVEENSSRCEPLLAWRLCSGYAHGRPWAFLGMSDRDDRFETTELEVVKMRLTSDPSKVLYPARQAFLLMVDVVELMQSRASTPGLTEEQWELLRITPRNHGFGPGGRLSTWCRAI
jgi:hypothetical protein